ncbi:MAG: winged helix-turn-helix transcriptional regulator [Microbacteriaceae bacterium]|nr:winged helix-turn-helix transcriptional regulator [Microbacteriaceae bacterium]
MSELPAFTRISVGDSRVHFSPERALEAIDDRWGLLVLQRAIFQNAHSFEDFRAIVGISVDVLDARLTALAGAGLLERVPGVNVGESASFYLTARGRTIEPVILALSSWRDSWTETPEDEVVAHLTMHPETEMSGQKLSPQIEVNLLGGFSIRIGGESLFSVSLSSQRLIGFLGAHSHPVPRAMMATRLWPDASEVNAGVSLRSALSRLDSASRTAVLSSPGGLSLQPSVSVDLRDARLLASRLMKSANITQPLDLDDTATALLSADIFPDLYEAWAIDEADDWRHRRVNALERQAERLLETDRWADAAHAARAAIKAEPLRESPYAILIRTHLAEGNQSQALRVFDLYSALLSTDLQLRPTVLLSRLVQDIRRPGV